MRAAIVFLVAALALTEASPVTNGQPSNGTEVRKHKPCESKKDNAKPVLGRYVPQCDEDGNFEPQQCWGSTGECWCVNTLTGEEIPNTKTGPGEEPVDCNEDSDCPDSWTRYGEHCYIFIDSPKSWAEAESYCQFEEGNLASIHSYKENHFLQTLTRGDTHDFPHTWVGGTNAVDTFFWMWSDGSRFVYENWFDDDEEEREDSCLKINSGYQYEWASSSCKDELPFVCSKEMED